MFVSSIGADVVVVVPMASRTHAGPGHVSGTKLVYSSGGSSSSSVGCLPFSQNRHSLPNYPDIVDNEICFQPVNSDNSINELSVSDVRLEAPVSVGLSVTSSSDRDGVQGHSEHPSTRSAMTADSHHRPSQGNPGNLYPALGEANLPAGGGQLGGAPGQGHARTSHLPPYRQIQTRDANVGVSTRIAPHHSDALPDLLHSHISPPTPVTPTRPNQHRQRNGDRRGHGSDQRTRNQTRHRNHDNGSRSRRARRTTHGRSNSSSRSDDGSGGVCKEPCIKCFVKVTSFRWVLVVLSMLGVCCVVTGIVLAALHAAGNSFLFLAIMFIGKSFSFLVS